MPIEYVIIENKNLVLAKGIGVVTAVDVIDHLRALANDDRYTAPMKKLIDYRSINSITISPDEAHKIAQTKKQFSSKFMGEICAFVSPEPVTYGTSRVHQALVEDAGINTSVFKSMEEASEWLEVILDHDEL